MSHRILLVDDQGPVLAAIAGTLGRAGFDVDRAASASAALDQLTIHHPTLLLTDYRMPGCDGICLLRRVRARSGAAALPAAIFSAAFVDEGLEAEAQRLSARVYAPVVRPRHFVQIAQEMARLAALVSAGADLGELCRAAPLWSPDLTTGSDS